MRKTYFRIALVMILALCMVWQVFAGGQRQAADELPVLRVAVMPWQASLPAIHIAEQGWDVENGFRIERSVYPMGAPLIEAMGANLWDIAVIGPAAVFAIANVGLKVIAPVSGASGSVMAFVRPDHPAAQIRGQVPGYPNIYGSAATLRGSRALVPVGSMNHYNVLQWISIFGLGPNDIEVVHMDNAASFQAFRVGEGDITAFSTPISYAAQREGWVAGGELFDLNIHLMDYLYANPRMYERNKDLIVKYVSLMYRANEYFNSDLERTAQTLHDWMNSNGLNATMDDARRDIASRPYVTAAQARGTVPGTTMRMIAEFYTEIGTLERERLAGFNNDTMVTEILEMALR